MCTGTEAGRSPRSKVRIYIVCSRQFRIFPRFFKMKNAGSKCLIEVARLRKKSCRVSGLPLELWPLRPTHLRRKLVYGNFRIILPELEPTKHNNWVAQGCQSNRDDYSFINNFVTYRFFGRRLIISRASDGWFTVTWRKNPKTCTTKWQQKWGNPSYGKKGWKRKVGEHGSFEQYFKKRVEKECHFSYLGRLRSYRKKHGDKNPGKQSSVWRLKVVYAEFFD